MRVTNGKYTAVENAFLFIVFLFIVMSGTYIPRVWWHLWATTQKRPTKTETLFPPVFISCGRSISWICWCFYTFSSLTVSKVHCSFIERLMLEEYLIKCFIVRCSRKSYFWCYETSIIFSRESPFFPSLGKHYVSKEFWFLILFSEKKLNSTDSRGVLFQRTK